MRTRQGARIIQEGTQLCKAIPTRNVVDQNCTSGAAVITPAHAPKAFGAGGIPELQLYSFSTVAVADFYDFGSELYTDCLRGENTPGRVDEAVEEAGLASGRRTQEDDLGEIVGLWSRLTRVVVVAPWLWLGVCYVYGRSVVFGVTSVDSEISGLLADGYVAFHVKVGTWCCSATIVPRLSVESSVRPSVGTKRKPFRISPFPTKKNELQLLSTSLHVCSVVWLFRFIDLLSFWTYDLQGASAMSCRMPTARTSNAQSRHVQRSNSTVVGRMARVI
ncbi:hypothetical protein KCU81_g751, partial [Aureobasidium melanogenum]